MISNFYMMRADTNQVMILFKYMSILSECQCLLGLRPCGENRRFKLTMKDSRTKIQHNYYYCNFHFLRF